MDEDKVKKQKTKADDKDVIKAATADDDAVTQLHLLLS